MHLIVHVLGSWSLAPIYYEIFVYFLKYVLLNWPFSRASYLQKKSAQISSSSPHGSLFPVSCVAVEEWRLPACLRFRTRPESGRTGLQRGWTCVLLGICLMQSPGQLAEWLGPGEKAASPPCAAWACVLMRALQQYSRLFAAFQRFPPSAFESSVSLYLRGISYR